MIQKIKQWWVAVLGVALSILDLGFDAINPILSQIDLPMWVFSIVKVVFAIYGIYRLLKQQAPDLIMIAGTDNQNPPPPGDGAGTPGKAP